MQRKTILLTCILFVCTIMSFAQKFNRPESYNYKRGVEAIQNEKPDEALEYLNKEISENPKNGYAFSWIAMIRQQHEEYGQAAVYRIQK